MRILKYIPLVVYLAALPAFSEEPHDHDHDHDDHDSEEAHHDEDSNLMEQLGYGMTTVEDRLIAGRAVTALPIAAVFYEGMQPFVLAQNEKDPHQFSRWKVELGDNDDRFVEAKTGVFPGDKVIALEQPLLSIKAELERAKATAQARGPEPAPRKASISTPAKSGGFGVQIGAFSKEENANRIAGELKPKYGRTDVLISQSNGRSLYRVRVGEYPTLRSAKDSTEKLKATGFPGAFVVAIN